MWKMRLQLSWVVVLLCYSLLPPTAFATQDEDFLKAKRLYNQEDIKEATQLLKILADQNYIPAQVYFGEIMLGGSDYEEAFGWFLTAAFQGDATGQHHLGYMYASGLGVTKSPEKAFYWTKKAAEQNYLPSVKVLAQAYKPRTDNKPTSKDEYGVEPNQEQADFWGAKLPALEKAAAKAQKKLDEDTAAEIAAYIEEQKKLLKKKLEEDPARALCGLRC